MKRLLFILTIILASQNLSIAQIPKEAFPLGSSLRDLWHNGNTEAAVDSSLKLYQLSPPLFIINIHATLAQQLSKSSKLYGQKYLEQMLLNKNEEINKIITPIYIWSKALSAKKEVELNEVLNELNSILKDSANYVSRNEAYCLLTLQELYKKKAIDKITQEKILHTIINNLEAYPYLDKVKVETINSGGERAWYRYLLAYSYNELFSINPNNEEYLKKASDYSPDSNDRQYRDSYFYNYKLLTDNVEKLGFRAKYLKYLTDNNRSAEAINLLSNITFVEPSDDNMTSLKNFYKELNNPIPFNDYWRTYINKMAAAVPQIKLQFEKEELDLTKKNDNWIYVDIWGTWCSPCVGELPELQSFYSENDTIQNSNLKIYTFSYNSKNLKEFISKNNYTFPVSEVDKEAIDSFRISGFPTKILITPERNYIKIPFGVDWKMYIRNYML